MNSTKLLEQEQAIYWGRAEEPPKSGISSLGKQCAQHHIKSNRECPSYSLSPIFFAFTAIYFAIKVYTERPGSLPRYLVEYLDCSVLSLVGS